MERQKTLTGSPMRVIVMPGRITSCLIACSLLLVLSGWTGQATNAAPSQPVPEPTLQDQVDALVQQLHLRYQGQPSELAWRRDHVQGVLKSWNALREPTAEDRAMLRRWLSASLEASMPGRTGRAYVPPTFGLASATPNPSSQPEQQSLAKPVLEEKEPAKQRSKWSRHPAAAPLEWVDPFQDVEDESYESTSNPLRSGARTQRVFRPVSDEALPGGAVEIDFDELTDRFADYAKELREANLELLAMDRPSVEQLERVANRLESLASDRDFLTLYSAGLLTDDRGSVPELPGMELVSELARRKAQAGLERTSGDDAARLRRVSERLASL